MTARDLNRSGNTSFVVRIYYTENGTWQGQVAHVQSGEMYSFQSMLELMRFMDGHIPSEEENRSWEANGSVSPERPRR